MSEIRRDMVISSIQSEKQNAFSMLLFLNTTALNNYNLQQQYLGEFKFEILSLVKINIQNYFKNINYEKIFNINNGIWNLNSTKYYCSQ